MLGLKCLTGGGLPPAVCAYVTNDLQFKTDRGAHYKPPA